MDSISTPDSTWLLITGISVGNCLCDILSNADCFLWGFPQFTSQKWSLNLQFHELAAAAMCPPVTRTWAVICQVFLGLIFRLGDRDEHLMRNVQSWYRSVYDIWEVCSMQIDRESQMFLFHWREWTQQARQQVMNAGPWSHTPLRWKREMKQGQR